MQSLIKKSNLLELLSSMRFAISLLTILAIASIIGTVLKQNEPYANYIIQFGTYWFKFFEILGLYDVYHSSWFLVILIFLVISTSLCIYRHTPTILKEVQSYREHITFTSLKYFKHKAEFTIDIERRAEFQQNLQNYLTQQGYKFKTKENLIAGKHSASQRFGYIFTHVAIVVICIGGLIDGNIPLKLQDVVGALKIETRDLNANQVPKESQLSPNNLSFRGNITIPEGFSADVVFLNIKDGYLLQNLPFNIYVKKFHIEHYETGQPKDFASDVIIVDKESKKTFQGTIKVNHPIEFSGVSIYQASFADGGTKLKLNSYSLFTPNPKGFEVEGEIKNHTTISNGSDQYKIEFTDFRPFNVEPEADPNKIEKSLSEKIAGNFGSSAKKQGEKKVKNVGPSFQYKIRDAQGQAKEYNNYMLPLQIDGRWFMASGMRASPAEPFRYVYFPLFNGSFDEFNDLRSILFDKAKYPEIAKRFVKFALPADQQNSPTASRLEESAEKMLRLYSNGGFDALSQFITKVVPKEQQKTVTETYLKMLEGIAVQAFLMSQENSKKPTPNLDENTIMFVRDALNSISDIFFYGAPIYLQLNYFEEVKATGLQLTKSPGKDIVYFGSVMLIIGVFMMLYMRERRLFVMIMPQDELENNDNNHNKTNDKKYDKILFAMTTNRQTLQFEEEFVTHREYLNGTLSK